MIFEQTELEGAFLIKPKVFGDNRGYFCETFRQDLFENSISKIKFVQDNESKSSFGVVRGLHYQSEKFAQSKLIRVISGRILDVIVDIRKNSNTFGKHIVIELNDDNKHQLFVPKGFAHGFSVLSQEAIINYKCDEIYNPQAERGILYNDKQLGINWGVSDDKIILSDKDLKLPSFEKAEYFNYL
jgi:dTDP-4-dehydrorhamnose 3,5-epimerase